MEITVETRSVYGRDLVYPVCHKASLFCEICGTETITPHMLTCIAELGYAVLERPRSNPAIRRVAT